MTRRSPHSAMRSSPPSRASAPLRSPFRGRSTAPTTSSRTRCCARCRTFDRFERGTNLNAWLFTILRNLFHSEYRKRRREVEDPDGSYAGRLKVQPEQGSRLDFEDFRRRARAICRTTSARRCCSSAPRASPTRRRPRSAAAPSGRSRAGSTARAPGWRTARRRRCRGSRAGPHDARRPAGDS